MNAKNSFSLVEILVALSLSSFLLFVISQYYSTQYQILNKQKEQHYLQQAAHQIMDYFRQHIEHIGYIAKSNGENNLALFTEKAACQLTPHCLMFIYDVNSDGCIGTKKRNACSTNGVNQTDELAKESFGFKIENKAIYIYDQGNQFKRCNSLECRNLLESCANNNWHQLTFNAQYNVERLDFNWEEKGKLMKVNLTLSSVKQASLTYEMEALIYLWNAE